MVEPFFENPYVFKLLQSAGLLVAVIVLARVAVSIARKREQRNSETPYAIKYAAIIFFAFGLVLIWLEGITPILTALTIVAAALTIVSKEMILNFFGSFVIFWRELFAIGDRVQVGEHCGDVIDKGLLYFTLLEAGQSASTGHSTGRLIKVPNALVHTMPVINATRGAGYVWNEIRVSVTHSSDWEQGRTVLLELADEFIADNDLNLERVKASFERRKVYFKTLTPKVYVSITDGAVRLTLRYVCRARLVRESEDFLFTEILRRLPASGIQLSDRQEA